MATASIKHGAHKLLGHSKSAVLESPPVNDEKCQQEKQFIADCVEHAKPLPPDQVSENPRYKELATSSKNLRIQDFELIKTLGTGKRIRRCSQIYPCIGVDEEQGPLHEYGLPVWPDRHTMPKNAKSLR